MLQSITLLWLLLLLNAGCVLLCQRTNYFFFFSVSQPPFGVLVLYIGFHVSLIFFSKKEKKFRKQNRRLAPTSTYLGVWRVSIADFVYFGFAFSQRVMQRLYLSYTWLLCEADIFSWEMSMMIWCWTACSQHEMYSIHWLLGQWKELECRMRSTSEIKWKPWVCFLMCVFFHVLKITFSWLFKTSSYIF